MIDPVLAKKVLEHRKKLAKKNSNFELKSFLFKEQLAFVSDPARFKIAMCSRRAGKTISCAAHLIKTAIDEPGVVCLYVTLSRNNAKKIIWREIQKINRDYKLDGVENISELSYSFPNGSMLYLSGAKDESEIEKFRGMAIKLAYIDEAQSFRPYIKEMINSVLTPALMDGAGSLCLIGTPPPLTVGYFYETFNNPSKVWGKHHWTFFQNPFIVKKSKLSHQTLLDQELERRGVLAEDPSIQREWFGKCVGDTDTLLIHYDPKKNDFLELPPMKYNYILGVDLGFNDADALAVMAWSEGSPNVYMVEELVTTKQDITQLAQQIQRLRDKYSISKMVIDAGALGKKITEELIKRHQLPLEAADKTRKMENVALLNDYLRSGRFKTLPGSRFAQDTYLVEIDKEKSTPDKIKVSDRYHSDIIDAVLYAFKLCYAYTYKPMVPKLQVGSVEWAQQQREERFAQELERAREFEESQNGGFDWDSGF